MKYVLALLFVILTAANCQPVEQDVCINPKGLASLEWGPHLQGLGALQFPEDHDIPHLRGKRFISLADSTSETPKPNKPYQACIAPGEKKGHCRHLSKCVLEEFRTDFSRFMDYFCIIERTYVGACCPDQAQVVATNSPSADTLAAYLPAVANTDDDMPIWGSVESKGDLEASGSDVSTATVTNFGDNNSTDSRASGEQRGLRGCGVSTRSRMRIVGGRPADPQEWPWMVALLRQETSLYCGGVLITDRHVLTAAHCVYQFKAREIRVRLGEYDFRKADETRALDFRVTEIRQHLDFDAATYENDIAIVKMHKPTMFNSYVWPICLPPTGLTFENKSAIVTGWGTQYFGGPASPVLMEVAVPIWPQGKCVRTFTQRIPETAMCAAAYEGGRDSCQGDSGGPLLHQLGNGRWVNVGIVSWGIRCGEPGHPGIYTRVNSYLDWIFANAIF